MILSQIINELSLPKEAILVGKAVLDFELNQVCLAMSLEDLTPIDLKHCLMVSPIDLFDADPALEHFESLAKDGKVASLLLTGPDEKIKASEIYKLCKQYNISLCCLGEDISPVLAINKIIGFYKTHMRNMEEIIQNHYLELIHLSTLDLGIPRIIKKSAEILGNPLVVTDESYDLVGYSSSGEVDDPIWKAIVESGYCPIDIVKILRYEGFEKQLEREASPLFLTQGEFSKYIRRLVTEIRIGGQLKGYMALLEYEKPITPMDQEILKFVSAVIALEFAKSDAIAKARGYLGQELLADLVKGNISSEASAWNRVKSLDWSLGEYFQVLLIANRENRSIGGEYYDSVQSIALRYIPASKISFSSKFIVILATSNSKDMLTKALPVLEKFCQQHYLCIGIGRAYKTLMEIPQSFNEAQKALLLADSIERPGIVHYYDDIAVYDLLAKVKNNYRVHPGLYRLIEYDKNNGTDYVKTLSVYLRNYKNLSQTAEDLFLHRNTILYRLKKIEEILQASLDNHSLCLQLELGILLLDLK
ncbi:MAG TPA: helix-turn-helix domain-containing protein [Tepidanaerobacteraceae bacterium]|nr:helix-turn-helix domain-containing protein [Tepidanaerobacteraceae bacterium]